MFLAIYWSHNQTFTNQMVMQTISVITLEIKNYWNIFRIRVSSTKPAIKAKGLLDQFLKDETLFDFILPAQPVTILEHLKGIFKKGCATMAIQGNKRWNCQYIITVQLDRWRQVLNTLCLFLDLQGSTDGLGLNSNSNFSRSKVDVVLHN